MTKIIRQPGSQQKEGVKSTVFEQTRLYYQKFGESRVNQNKQVNSC